MENSIDEKLYNRRKCFQCVRKLSHKRPERHGGHEIFWHGMSWPYLGIIDVCPDGAFDFRLKKVSNKNRN